MMIGSDTLIYRLLFNLTENAIRYNRENASVIITVDEKIISFIYELKITVMVYPSSTEKVSFNHFPC